MRNLSTFLNTPFDDRQISLAELASFATDHLERMIANDAGGALAPRIAATAPVVAALDEALDDDVMKLAHRKARKFNKDQFRDGLPAETGMVYGIVSGTYGEQSDAVLECFPKGRTIFSDAPDDELDTWLSALAQGVEDREDDLGPAVVTKAADLLATWEALYAASEAATGDKTTTQEEKAEARKILQWVLYENLMAIAKIYPRDGQKLSLYMQPHLLGMPQDFTGSGPGTGGGDESSEEESSMPSSEDESSMSSEDESSISSEESSFSFESSSEESSIFSSEESSISSSEEPPFSSSEESSSEFLSSSESSSVE